jgi:ferrochelatase
MAVGCRYEAQLAEACRLVAEGVGRSDWKLAYQSRSGPPQQPWLEPDIDDHLRNLARDGCSAAVVVPIGFVSDHMEVLWDLDTQARATAAEVGLPMVRVATPGADPRMVAMVGELIKERIDGTPPERRVRVGGLAASPDRCAAGCCPNPRSPLAAVGGSDPIPAP